MPEFSDGSIHNGENNPQYGLLEPQKFGRNEILRFKPEDKDIRLDPSTGEKVKPLLYVQGINGDPKLPRTLENFAKEQQREIIAIRYSGKLEGSTIKRNLVTISADTTLTSEDKLKLLASDTEIEKPEKDSTVTEMDFIQSEEIIAALEMLGIDQVDAVAESRGAIRLVTAMQTKPELFRHAYLAHPAGLDDRNYFQSHKDAIRGILYHAARKVMGKIEKHGSTDKVKLREKRWFRDPKGWRKEQKSVAFADIRGALTSFAKEHPDKQITIAGDKNDKSFLSERLAQNAGKSDNLQVVETDWGAHGIGFNPKAISEISTCLNQSELSKSS